MLQPGDIVMLKTGGPKMTVDACHSDTHGAEHIHAVWFCLPLPCIQCPHREEFPVEAVEVFN